MQTSRQLKDYVLCHTCETLLNKAGETWLLPKLATIDPAPAFPLYAILQKVSPEFSDTDLTAYACSKNPEIDVSKITHFALGVFWKASVHPWSAKRYEPMIDLGPYTTEVGEFLQGRRAFPEYLALLVKVQPHPVKLISFTYPSEGDRDKHHRFSFYIPGIQFTLGVGKKVKAARDLVCFYSHPLHPIVVQDIEPLVKSAFRGVSATAKKSSGLIEYLKKQH